MSLVLDHVVVLVADLEAAIADYGALGFNVQRGGVHAGGATHNALVGFADGSYLELIAFLKPEPAHRWAPAAQRGIEGFIDFALLPDSVPAVVAAARGRGLDFQGPVAGGRLRTDGQRLQWQIGLPPTRDLPFLCGDLTPRALRVGEGELRVHANGVSGVAVLTVLVDDLEASLARYAALLGPAEVCAVRCVALPGLGLHQALLPLGAATLALVAPGPEAPEAAPLRARLALHGPGLIGLALHAPAGAAAQAWPRARTHGAAFETVPGAA